MSEPFAKKLELVLKVLSMSRARLAADLGVDKSVVGRWVSGAVQPSAHNLSLLSGLIAQRIAGFTTLDWDRSLAAFAELIGADLKAVASHDPSADSAASGLPILGMEQFLAATSLRGPAYEGFYRTTRPYILSPGRFIHDHAMVRTDPNGLMRIRIGAGGTIADGWILPAGNQLFAVTVDVISGAVLFGIFHGVATPKAEVIDGLVLAPSLDVGRTPAAYPMLLERVEDLSGEISADDHRFLELAARDPVAPEGSVPEAVRRHLCGDFGPAAMALGGDLLLRLPLLASMSRGPAYREAPIAANDRRAPAAPRG
ncbi:helix-turn-helix transcriptional regulator [Phenylobacterium sp.]|jgi:transcriptional regulator with XRE-family HTH domain|uniref:helix-turn-helix domain-containing protein n=1 Tax=Phenylobacterium sp. TaxID=1871053 RepID=UPI002E354F53|nr:helix-turn-helix transcriptional regulator [Phenylobacterium sp.]HEX3366628.1 helix-turn-helix transcriptional regulator [Phenylobacterium sp.]